MLDVGAGDAEGERVGEMLERRGEEREAERVQAQAGRRMPPPATAPPTTGALDRNNKEMSTSL